MRFSLNVDYLLAGALLKLWSNKDLSFSNLNFGGLAAYLGSRMVVCLLLK